MEELQELKKKVEHLEYDEIKVIKEDVNDIKITLNTNNLLTKQLAESNDKLGTTMETFKNTMVDIVQSVKDANKVSSQLADTVEQLNKKISTIEQNTNNSLKEFGDKLEEIDDKSKIDLLLWLRNNWIGIVGIGGIIYTIVSKVI